MKNPKTLIGFQTFVLTCFGCASICIGQAVIEPADQTIVLTGTLRLVRAYGPPGFGMNRKEDKIRYWALELPFEINLDCVPDRPEFADIECGATKRPRLFFFEEHTSSESKARKLIGKRVKVTGSLHRWTTNAEMTPVYVDVLDVAPAPRTK